LLRKIGAARAGRFFRAKKSPPSDIPRYIGASYSKTTVFTPRRLPEAWKTIVQTFQGLERTPATLPSLGKKRPKSSRPRKKAREKFRALEKFP
jgi:hypothetical protein